MKIIGRIIKIITSAGSLRLIGELFELLGTSWETCMLLKIRIKNGLKTIENRSKFG
jgi:hypothetical protein